jgi:hypothetical protein
MFVILSFPFYRGFKMRQLPKKFFGIWGLGLLLFSLISCQGLPWQSSETFPIPTQLPSNWAQQTAKAIVEKFPDLELKILFLGPPSAKKVWYRYWTSRHYEGLTGLVALRGQSKGQIFASETGPWYVVYVLGAALEPVLITEKLESTDVTPPIYTFEVVDQTEVGIWQFPKPIALEPEIKEKLRRFLTQPYSELIDYE